MPEKVMVPGGSGVVGTVPKVQKWEVEEELFDAVCGWGHLSQKPKSELVCSLVHCVYEHRLIHVLGFMLNQLETRHIHKQA